MTDYETAKYEAHDSIAVITINRPDAMNSFNSELRRDLLAAFQQADADASVRVIVFTG